MTVSKKILGPVALLTLGGCYHILNQTLFKDSTAPCIEIGASNGNIDLNISDIAGECKTEHTIVDDDITMSNTTTERIERHGQFSNITEVDLFVDGSSKEIIPLSAENYHFESTFQLKGLAYGEHRIEIEAYDSERNKATKTFKVFAYDDLLIPQAQLHTDTKAPSWSKSSFATRKPFTGYLEDLESGLRKVEILKDGESIFRRAMSSYSPKVDLAELTKEVHVGKGAYKLLATDTNGNTLEETLEWNGSYKIGQAAMGGD